MLIKINSSQVGNETMDTGIHAIRTISLFPSINWKAWEEFVCKLDGYLVEIGLLLPAWIMVVLAAERFVIIMWPLRKNVKLYFF